MKKVKIKENINEIKEERKMKKFSLSKKILIGLGVLGAGVVGAIAYSKSNKDGLDEQDVYDEVDAADYDSDYDQDSESNQDDNTIE